MAERMNYPAMVTGLHDEDGMNMIEVIRRLRSGQQAPMNLPLIIPALCDQPAGYGADDDSITLLTHLQEAVRLELFAPRGEFPGSIYSQHVRNVLERHAEDFLQRMKREYDAFGTTLARHGRKLT